MTIVDRGETLTQATLDDVHILVWKHAVDAAALERTRGVAIDLAKRFPRGYWSINVVSKGVAIPNFAEQRRASEISRELDRAVRGTIVVIPGDGFWVSAARGFITGLDLLSPLGTKREIVASVGEACAILARRAERSGEWARSLESAIAEATQ